MRQRIYLVVVFVLVGLLTAALPLNAATYLSNAPFSGEGGSCV